MAINTLYCLPDWLHHADWSSAWQGLDHPQEIVKYNVRCPSVEDRMKRATIESFHGTDYFSKISWELCHWIPVTTLRVRCENNVFCHFIIILLLSLLQEYFSRCTGLINFQVHKTGLLAPDSGLHGSPLEHTHLAQPRLYPQGTTPCFHWHPAPASPHLWVWVFK